MSEYVHNFEMYALQQLNVQMLDLMCWAILVGALDLALTLWAHTRSPIRAALIGADMCNKILHRVPLSQQLREELQEKQGEFTRQATGLLDKIVDEDVAEKLLLNAEGPFAWLGQERRERGSILDLAIALKNKQVIAHQRCAQLIKNAWHGHSAQCGRVCIKTDPSLIGVFTQICLLPIKLKVLDIGVNDFYAWPEPGKLDPSSIDSPNSYMRVHWSLISADLMLTPLVKCVLKNVRHCALNRWTHSIQRRPSSP
jgi:hypothetical protein